MNSLVCANIHYHAVGNGITPTPAPNALSLDGAGVALRCVGIDDLDVGERQTCFFFSSDRGFNWQGPFLFTGLMDSAPLIERLCPKKIEHVACGIDTCLVFMSARLHGHRNGREKTFVAETNDGGKTFRFVSWIVLPDDPHSAVLPTATRLSDGTIIVALGRRMPDMSICWVHTYASTDNGKTWIFLSAVGDNLSQDSVAPVLGTLSDGRLACAYYVRARNELYGHLSADGGKTWDKQIVLRDNVQEDACNDSACRHPYLVQNNNRLMAVYDWAVEARFHQHITLQLRLAQSGSHFRKETIPV